MVNFGEVRRAQLAKSTFLTSMLVPLRFSKVCSDVRELVVCRKQREATAPIKSLVKLQPLRRITALVPEFAVKDLSLGRTLMMIMMIYKVNWRRFI